MSSEPQSDADPLSAIRARLATATPGPWQTRFIYRLFEASRSHPRVLMQSDQAQDWPDSEFIAHARTDIPTLLALYDAALARPSVENCQAERAEGNGGCGACALCCKEWRERAEQAEARIAALGQQGDA